MNNQVNPALIGAFIVGALLLVVAGVLLFGSGRLFKDTAACVMYFDGDVQGLNVGAAVKFRGVKLGDVTAISTRIDRKTLEVRIPVYVELIEPHKHLYGRSLEGEPEDPIKALVDRGLRAQLQVESLVTGQLFVQLDFYADTPPPTTPLIDPASGLHEIPTVPTILQKAQTTLRQVLEKLDKLRVEEMLAALQGALVGADQLLNSPELKRVPAELTATLGDIRRLVAETERRITPMLVNADHAITNINEVARELRPLAANANQTVSSLHAFVDREGTQLVTEVGRTARAAETALAQTRETMASLEALTLPTSATGHQLREALAELTAAARAVRGLADALEEQPNSVIFGKPAGAAE